VTPAVTNDTPATPEPPATVDAAPVATEPAVQPDQTPAPDTTPATTDNALPATASSLPLIAFLGVLSILGAFALRFASRLS
jgi:hypothetical protein